MSVDSRNEYSAKRLPQWRRTRHATAGAVELVPTATDYIERLTDQTGEEYRAYIRRAAYFEATGRTLEALVGFVFDKPPVVEVTAETEPLIYNSDGAATSIQTLARSIVEEQLQTAWGAVVVHHTGNPDNPGTAANPSGQPAMRYYPAESILDWRFGVVKGIQRLTMLRLHEVIAAEGEDEFTPSAVEQIRVLDIDESGFRERLYRQNDKAEWFLSSVAFPIANGARLPRVPAVLVTPSADKRKPGSPPLSAIAETNISHWRTTADLEHAAHFCGLPTPYVTGVSAPPPARADVLRAIDGNDGILTDSIRPRYDYREQGPVLRLGSTKAFTLSDTASRAGFLEFTGQGLTPLQSLLDRKERHMAVLGARLLGDERLAAESGEALRIRRAGETAPLIKVALAVSEALTEALAIAAEWQGGDGDAQLFELNTQYGDKSLDAVTITALVQAWQGGALSFDSLLFSLKQGGHIPEGVSIEDEKELIEQGPKPLALQVDPFAGAF